MTPPRSDSRGDWCCACCPKPAGCVCMSCTDERRKGTLCGNTACGCRFVAPDEKPGQDGLLTSGRHTTCIRTELQCCASALPSPRGRRQSAAPAAGRLGTAACSARRRHGRITRRGVVWRANARPLGRRARMLGTEGGAWTKTKIAGTPMDARMLSRLYPLSAQRFPKT